MILNLNPLHMDPDPKVELNANANGKKVVKVNILTTNWVRMVLFTAKVCQILVDLDLHIHLDPVMELNPGNSNSRLFSHDVNSRSESRKKWIHNTATV